MRIGIDFDNTLVCYDQLFWSLAYENGLIDKSISRRKDAVRDNLRQRGLESDWTRLQGEAYGPRILDASPFPESLAAIREFVHRGYDIFIVSHKTKHPFAGARYDLHLSAKNWLITQGLIGSETSPIKSDQVFFELTKKEKLHRIEQLKCDWFVDDLPELLTDSDFPSSVQRILFDPHQQHHSLPRDIRILTAWRNVSDLIGADLAS